MNIQNPEYEENSKSHNKLHDHVKAEFTQFLQTWESQNGIKKYVKQADLMLGNSKHIMVISSADFYAFKSDLAQAITSEYSRFEPCLNQALTEWMSQIQRNYLGIESSPNKQEEVEQYYVAFDKAGILEGGDASVRDLKCEMLGKLRSIVGTVTRVSEIRPELVEGVFQCGYCGKLSQKIPQQHKYTTPKKCLNPNRCDNNSLWELNNKHSVFGNFQKLRLQEDASKIPPGSMPRSIDVILRNENIEKGQPGDQVHVVGYLTVIPDVNSLLKPGQRTSVFTRNTNTRQQRVQDGVNGIKGIKELTYKLCFMGTNLFVMNNQFNQEILTEEEAEQDEAGLESTWDHEHALKKLLEKYNQNQQLEILRIRQNPRIYEHLAQSLFNQIFGHIQIKKALLLQLLGGIHKKTQSKISLRGDINILIVGDPSTAKSQFLKCVNKFVPRSVYTNGKTTTAAGLTASVVRDQESGNVSIEAGALLLADNGICCIDEFDKMDIKDQVAIHEAMEQQTISIAKAGVQATLHARTSILAAANPLDGRYNKSESLRKNINISPPIMSRFDLYFIICDQVNEGADERLSQFIVSMHQQKKPKLNVSNMYSIKQIKAYLTLAKKIKPRLSQSAARELRRSYVELRKNDKQSQNTQYQVTVRQLESMIRLSEALAKLHLDYTIKQEYVREAYRLLSCSILKLEKSAIELAAQSSISSQEKSSLGLRGMMKNNQSDKKEKKLSVSFEVYSQIRKDVMGLFKQKQRRHKKERIQDVQMYITEEDVIAYLISINYENGDLASQVQNQKMKKIYHAIISKMVKENYLIVLEQTKNIYERKLGVHPNLDSAQEIQRNLKKQQL